MLVLMVLMVLIGPRPPIPTHHAPRGSPAHRPVVKIGGVHVPGG